MAKGKVNIKKNKDIKEKSKKTKDVKKKSKNTGRKLEIGEFPEVPDNIYDIIKPLAKHDLDTKKLKKPNRSDSYQALFLEHVFPSEILEAFANEDSVHKRLNPFAYNDEIAELQDKLKVEFWRIVDEHLTERQKEVVKLISSGLTQQEIAKLLNVNQSSITKSINGNVDYKEKNVDKNNKHIIYGGSKRKLKKIIETDTKVIEILDRIAELRDEKWS